MAEAPTKQVRMAEFTPEEREWLIEAALLMEEHGPASIDGTGKWSARERLMIRSIRRKLGEGPTSEEIGSVQRGLLDLLEHGAGKREDRSANPPPTGEL